MIECLELKQWASPSPEHLQWQKALRHFVDQEIQPFATAWDEAETFPRELYHRSGAIGLSGLGYPAELGGTPCDTLTKILTILELSRAGIGGLNASLLSHTIMVGPLLLGALESVAKRVIPRLLSGQAIGALAVTEPSGGSDVAALKTYAQAQVGPQGEPGFVINGSKCYITSGMRADYILVAARTGGTGSSGLSLFLVEAPCHGLQRNLLKKTGWWCSDTAELFFSDCWVPAENLVGPIDRGFGLIMKNFNDERLVMAAGATGFAITCFEESLQWARDRQTFGKALIDNQVIRHKFVSMLNNILPMLHWLAALAKKADAHELNAGEVALAKNQSARLMRDCADTAIQVMGGGGYMRGSKSERIYREVKVMMIGGGSEEVMNDLAARQLGIV